MNAIAVIIGIDGYAQQPLTSAVNDAFAFRDALIELELVDEQAVTLLTSPPRTGGGEATWAQINAVLKEIHDRGSRADRLYCFYAGHGLSAFVDPAHAVTQAALMPADIDDPAAQANMLINFDDFVDRMAGAGPAEQFFFVDACRDLVFADRPANLPKVGWPASPAPSPGVTSQAAIFAVSRGGQALGIPNGMGVMTGRLIDGLYGRGLALDWSDELDEYVITAESVTRHARARIEASLHSVAQWQHQVMLPELRPSGAPLTPLRIVSDPPRPTLTLTFDPEAAAADTDVELMLRGNPLQVPRWPPCRHGEAVVLRPYVYRIKAHSNGGIASPDPPKIDLREVQAATIHVNQAQPAPAPVAEPSPSDAVVADGVVPKLLDTGPSGAGVVRAQAHEPGAAIELIGQEPPYRRWESDDPLEVRGVPPGSYLIRFRLGSEVYSEAEFDLLAGEEKNVTPGGARSPLFSETGTALADGSVLASETIGPMRAGSLPTLLALLGALPFDTTGNLLPQMRHLVQPLKISLFANRPVRVVLAVDGSGWPVSPHEVAMDVTCELLPNGSTSQAMELAPVEPAQQSWGRIVHGTAAAPAGSFIVRLRSPYLGSIELAAAALPGRITVVGLAPTPDGRLDVIQHLLRVPGRAYDEPEPSIPYARFIRELVLGQRLYGTGELMRRTNDIPDAQTLRELLYAKWTDPILGCMAYFAWNQAVQQGIPELQGVAPSNTDITAQNLVKYFADLPDARVIAAYAGLTDAPPVVAALSPWELPVLSDTLRLLAGAGDAEAARWASHVAPESSWSLIWHADPAARFHSDTPCEVSEWTR